jgi:hypothetical protein
LKQLEGRDTRLNAELSLTGCLFAVKRGEWKKEQKKKKKKKKGEWISIVSVAAFRAATVSSSPFCCFSKYEGRNV